MILCSNFIALKCNFYSGKCLHKQFCWILPKFPKIGITKNPRCGFSIMQTETRETIIKDACCLIWSFQTFAFRNLGSLFSAFAKFFEISKISFPLIRIGMCTYQGTRNVSFSGNFAYAVKRWFYVEVSFNTATETWPKSTRAIQWILIVQSHQWRHWTLFQCLCCRF